MGLLFKNLTVVLTKSTESEYGIGTDRQAQRSHCIVHTRALNI